MASSCALLVMWQFVRVLLVRCGGSFDVLDRAVRRLSGLDSCVEGFA